MKFQNKGIVLVQIAPICISQPRNQNQSIAHVAFPATLNPPVLVRKRAKERERQYVCVCVLCVCEREKGGVCVCKCVCKCVCMRVHACVCVSQERQRCTKHVYRQRILMRVYPRVSVALRIPRERLSL